MTSDDSKDLFVLFLFILLFFPIWIMLHIDSVLCYPWEFVRGAGSVRAASASGRYIAGASDGVCGESQ